MLPGKRILAVMIAALATLLAVRGSPPREADPPGLPDHFDSAIVAFKKLCEEHPEDAACRAGLYG